MQFTPIDFDSVEQNLLWSALVLQSKEYAPKDMRNGATPVAPYFVSVAPLADGANQGDVYARISANIKLNVNTLYGDSPLALSALPDAVNDEVPSHLLSGLTLASSGSGGPTLYALPVSDAQLFYRAEDASIVDFYPTEFEDQSDYLRHGTVNSPTEYQVAAAGDQKAIAPVYNDGGQNGIDITNGTDSLRNWTVFFTLRCKAGSNASVYILSGNNSSILYVTDGTIDFEFQSDNDYLSASANIPAYDNKSHLYIFSFDSAGWVAYVDGVQASTGAWSDTFQDIQWTKFLPEYEGQFQAQDLILLGRKSSIAELNNVSDAISSYRGIATVPIS